MEGLFYRYGFVLEVVSSSVGPILGLAFKGQREFCLKGFFLPLEVSSCLFQFKEFSYTFLPCP